MRLAQSGILRIPLLHAQLDQRVEAFAQPEDLGYTREGDDREHERNATAGHGAEEVIHLFTLAMKTQLTASELAAMTYAYPTFSSDLKFLV